MKKKYYPDIQDWSKYKSIKTKLDIQANERDGGKCIKCGRKKGIETHHIVRGLETLENLITVCHRCHKKEHGMSGCFIKGYDARRNIENLKLSRLKGHSFRGNQYIRFPKE